MTLQEFYEIQRETLDAFCADWLKNHEENPEHYPMEMPEGNEGLWFEMFNDFEMEADDENVDPDATDGFGI